MSLVRLASCEMKVLKTKFPMIDISLKDQQKIVDEIKAELDAQEKMNRNIEAERNKIDEIIESAIK